MMETPSSTSSTGSSSQDEPTIAGGAAANRNLNAKYQKLAAEYAKLRSQVQVLKKAVVDEQQKHETLKSTITTQDQKIRKLDQELDSVKFRNRQLEKRIEILQESDSSNSTSRSHQQQPQSSSFDANLLLHVEQNKQLQESLATLTERYNTETTRLKRMIDNEMVPRDLLDSIKTEHQEQKQLLSKKLQQLNAQNADLHEKLYKHEVERSERQTASNVQSPDESGSNSLREKLVESEQQKERLNSEVQILRLKLKRLSIHEQPSPETSNMTTPTEEKNNMLGKMNILEQEQDHELVITYMKNRNNELVRNIALADSKALFYYYEAVNLCRLVRTGQLSYKRLDSEFDKLKVKYRNLCDELEDVKRGYNGQVDSLTEHIALLNEKLVNLMDK